jgi:hypothetical protein
MNNDMIEAAKRGRAQYLRDLESKKRLRKIAQGVKRDRQRSNLDALVSRLDGHMKNDDFNGFVRTLLSAKL